MMSVVNGTAWDRACFLAESLPFMRSAGMTQTFSRVLNSPHDASTASFSRSAVRQRSLYAGPAGYGVRLAARHRANNSSSVSTLAADLGISPKMSLARRLAGGEDFKAH